MNIRDIGQDALECLDSRHHWERERKHDMREPLFGTRRSDLCTRCGTWRHVLQRLDGALDWSTSGYEYSTAYRDALDVCDRFGARKELDRRASTKKRKAAA